MQQLQWELDEALRLCQEEEGRINDSTRRYREILYAMRMRESSPKREVSLTDTKGDSTEVELLQRALDKALRVRRASETRNSKGDSDVSKAAPAKHLPVKSTSKTLTQQPTGSHQSVAGRKVTVKPTEAHLGGRQSHSFRRAKHHPAAPPVAQVTSEKHTLPVKPAPFLQACDKPANRREITAAGAPREDRGGATIEGLKSSRVPNPELDCLLASDGGTRTLSKGALAWKNQRAKIDRLWDKVGCSQSVPVMERTHFMERLQSTFPDWLPAGSPMQTRAEVDRVSGLCRGLMHHYRTELRAERTHNLSDASWEKRCESQLMLEGLETIVSELLQKTERLWRESEAWERLQPPTGCRFHSRGHCEEPTMPPLCASLTCSSEAELKELEALRLRVNLLRHELHLQQVLTDALVPYIDASPTPGMLQGLYSLLGEGGLRFPALLQDTDTE